MAQLSGDIGPIVANQWIVWALDPSLVTPGQSLFLGLYPVDTDGVFYRGATTAPGAPYLDLVMQ